MKPTEREERYLLGQMSHEELLLFNAEMLSNPPMAERMAAWKSTLQHLEAGWLRSEITRAGRQWLLRRRLFQAALGMVLLALVSTAVWWLSARQHGQQPAAPTVKVSTALVAEDSSGPGLSDTATSASPLLQTATDTAVQPHIEVRKSSGMPVNEKPGDSIITGHVYTPSPVAFPKTQIFTVYAERDTLLYCQGGLCIRLPAGIYQNAAGKICQGKVQLLVDEYLDYFPMYLDKVTTCCNDSLLQSGGSCRIRATQQGQPVDVVPGRTYMLMFPASTPDPRMFTFYGEREKSGELNWLPENAKPAAESAAAPAADTAVGDVASDCCNNMGFDAYLTDCPDETEIRKYLLEFNRINPKLISGLMKDSQYLQLRFHYDGSGLVTGFDYIIDKKKYSRLDRQIMRFRRELGSTRLSGVSSPGTFSAVLKPYMRYSGIIRDMAAVSADNPNAAINPAATSYNIIVASQFRYINCDFFSNLPKTNATISGVESADEVRIFYTGFRAVARAVIGRNKATFYGSAINQDVIVIATRKLNGVPEMSITRTRTGPYMVAEAWEPFDLARIKAALTP